MRKMLAQAIIDALLVALIAVNVRSSFGCNRSKFDGNTMARCIGVSKGVRVSINTTHLFSATS